MPSPSLKCRHSAISSTVATLEKPPFIGRFSAFSLMEKSGCRYEGEELGSNLLYADQPDGSCPGYRRAAGVTSDGEMPRGRSSSAYLNTAKRQLLKTDEFRVRNCSVLELPALSHSQVSI
jgi:hypothetical protein